MIGLGKMGGNMSARLLRAGHSVVVHDRDPAIIAEYVERGGTGARDLAEVVDLLKPRRIVWLMIPAGAPVDETIDALRPRLAAGDIIIDGGNSNYHDTQRRAASLERDGIELVDCGTSGGIWGLELGYCLMIGGPRDAFSYCEEIFRALAQEGGYAHVGAAGAGHYVKMVHNGIEYGLLQAYAEGYEILNASAYELDLHRIAALWNRGSVVRSWLNELAERALEDPANVEALEGFVLDSGEGRWTVQEAVDLDVPAPVITLALLMRLRSRQDESYGAKLIAALRNEFGGHAVKK
ncbi:MAG: decarboxylating 6-phosphogluconate dehydrogenase [Gemmatimonadaceae bacterium]|nr:decarboxylating 6-phosphogluconate dehydrogenase [Gemmatimonadaceae bacterium]